MSGYQRWALCVERDGNPHYCVAQIELPRGRTPCPTDHADAFEHAVPICRYSENATENLVVDGDGRGSWAECAVSRADVDAAARFIGMSVAEYHRAVTLPLVEEVRRLAALVAAPGATARAPGEDG